MFVGTLIFNKMCQINLFQSRRNDVAMCLANESNKLWCYSKKINR